MSPRRAASAASASSPCIHVRSIGTSSAAPTRPVPSSAKRRTAGSAHFASASARNALAAGLFTWTTARITLRSAAGGSCFIHAARADSMRSGGSSASAWATVPLQSSSLLPSPVRLHSASRAVSVRSSPHNAARRWWAGAWASP